MTESKSPRKAALKRLADLAKTGDLDKVGIGELYPYGVFAREARNAAYDRDIVITGTVVLEQGLEQAIVHHINLRNDAQDMLFSGTAPIMRDLSDKIKLAYLLGIIGPLTMADLHCIRAIRNAFAHSRRHLDLDMDEFQEVIAAITAPDRWPLIMEGHTNQDQRERFIQTSFQFVIYLSVGAISDLPKGAKIRDQRAHVFEQ